MASSSAATKKSFITLTPGIFFPLFNDVQRSAEQKKAQIKEKTPNFFEAASRPRKSVYSFTIFVTGRANDARRFGQLVISSAIDPMWENKN